jgi:hypothetical protein
VGSPAQAGGRRRLPDGEDVVITRPVNVRIARGSREVPLELVYKGLSDDGMHMWEAATSFNPFLDTLRVDMLPAKTMIVFGDHGGVDEVASIETGVGSDNLNQVEVIATRLPARRAHWIDRIRNFFGGGPL